MRIHVLLRAAAGVLAAALLLLAIPPSKSADLIILKDGFTLHANVIKKVKTEFEPETKQAITITQGYELEDGARRIRLSWNQVLDGKKQEQTDKADIVALEIKFRRRLSAPARPILQINEVTAWNDKLVREFKADTEQGPIKAEQQLGFFSSQFARVDALNYSWSAYYFTRELGLDTVQSLLRKHPQLNQKNGKPNALQRFRIYRFLVQAGWYDAAEKELDQFLKDFPDEKEKAESARENLRELRNQQWADAIEQGFRAGRHRWTQDQLAQFLDKSKDEKLLVRARALKAKYEKANEDLKQARRFLTELPEQLKVGAEKQLAEAAAALLAEIRLDHFLPPEPDQAKTDRFKFQRLEAFLGMARQAERARQKGTKAAQPGELLAYAVTGWFLGSNVAEGKMDSAIRLWQARQFVLQHQRTHSVEKREKLVYAFQRDDLVPFDELAQLIGVLPPPEPEELMSSEKSNGLPAVLELATNLPWGRKKGVRYLVQLPPEYHHNRPYPVLFVLHHATNTARDMIGPWRGLAAEHGYILVAPQWNDAFHKNYSYTVEEHEAVVDVLRDLRRRFQVDSDRVFLFGLGDGAAMAFDVGLSHPDLFAGVVPMCGRPRMFSLMYYPNAAVLPFYVVTGDLCGETAKVTRKYFVQRWMTSGYPAIYFEYKGRGPEWFAAEPPMIFDWMDRKKRSTGIPGFGKCHTMRPTDDHFYWLSVDAIDPKRVNDPAQWSNQISPATVQGKIARQGNELLVDCLGVKRLTIWLGKDMVDFTKPVKIRINTFTTLSNFGKPIKPNVLTMLEDFYIHGDRQRLFYAKIEWDRF